MPPPAEPFSGSFDPEDITFLLRPDYAGFFDEPGAPDLVAPLRSLTRASAERVGYDAIRLACTLSDRQPGGWLVLVSLLGTGSLAGILVTRALRLLVRRVRHYSVSVLPEHGVDRAAMRAIASIHPPESLVFVDGYAGDFAAREPLVQLYDELSPALPPGAAPYLIALSDPIGQADLAAEADDYLLPCAIPTPLATGLVGDAMPGSDAEYRSCAYHASLAEHDQSRWIVDTVYEEITKLLVFPNDPVDERPIPWDDAIRRPLRDRARQLALDLMTRFDLPDGRRIRAGASAATHALLDGAAERLLVKQRASEDLRLARALAERQGVPVEVHPDLPYRGVAILRPDAH